MTESSLKTNRLLCFGEVLWDILPDGAVLGGAPLNFAYRLHSFGDEALLVSRLGDDDLGRTATNEMSTLGLPLDLVQIDRNYPTGTVVVRFHDGQPSYTIRPDAAYDRIEADEKLFEGARSADCIYFGTLAQRSGTSRDTLRSLLESAPQAMKFADMNLRPNCYTAETIHETLGRADIVKLSEEEISEVAAAASLTRENTAEFAHRLIGEWSLRCCIVTMGSEGARVFSGTEEYFVPAFEINVADTVGAGDAFSAGFAHKYLRGANLEDACRFASALGALAASKPGGTAPITQQEIDNLLRRLT